MQIKIMQASDHKEAEKKGERTITLAVIQTLNSINNHSKCTIWMQTLKRIKFNKLTLVQDSVFKTN